MRRLTLTVTPEEAGRTVKSLLRRELHMADGAIARVKTVPDGICLNGVHARTVDRVAAGDVLTVRIDDKRSGGKFTPVAVPLDILYEDADLLALNKPAGMAVHGGYDRGEPTVANALAAYLGPDAVFHPVNRLDRGTSGVMLVARSGYVHDRLRRVLHTDGFRRTYLAVACGTGLPPRGTIDLPIARADDGTTRRWRVENSWGAKIADKGYFTMSDDWFTEYVYEVAVPKALLPEEYQKALEEPATMLPAWDPMGALA